MALYPVIMCGGSGTRLWPASRASRPKQFARLIGERSLFQETALRVAGLSGAADIVVVAGKRYVGLIASQLAEIGLHATILLEPEPRDSAPAMAAAAAWIERQDANAVMAVLASDHHVPDADAFRGAVAIAAKAAGDDLIVTMGVAPTEPSTAYGYIAPGPALGAVRKVASFVEKPDEPTARKYIDDGYLWNSGNFVVKANTLLTELDRHAPDIARAARQAVREARPDSGAHALGETFRSAPKISIDYAVMEKTERAAVLPVQFKWSDLGAWDAVWTASNKDAAGNAADGDCLLVEAQDCLARAGEGMQITILGARNIAVVADAGQVLVCGHASSQGVKSVVEHWKASGRETIAPPAPFNDLAAAARWFDLWLRTSALPLWWSVGADRERGGYSEALSPEGEPLDLPRRGRVQARQAFVYAQAGLIGWRGPWRDAAWHAFDDLIAKYSRTDGLFRAVASPDGETIDDSAPLYDQAFALLAMSSLHRADPGRTDLRAQARALLESLNSLRHEAGGFRETAPHVFQSNAHMHLFEAALAWLEADGGQEWEALAAEIVDLALRRFLDPKGGFVREFFDASWAPAAGEDGSRIEPGHQFEWAWLLEKWGRRGHPEASAAAARLFEAGLKGVDVKRGVAVDALNHDFTIREAGARLWPQTEYLKAAIIFGDDNHALAAAQALARYLTTPAGGAWRDKMRADGTFVDEPAPASSFYHLIGACMSLTSAS